jgi:hypothetical protein
MADLRKRCPGCKRQFRPAKGTRRLYCETCRPPRERVPDGQPAASEDPGPIEVRVRAELEQADRLETVEAEVVLRLAREMDSTRPTGSQLAAMTPRLLAARTEALRGVKLTTDRLDEVTARRLAKAANA